MHLQIQLGAERLHVVFANRVFRAQFHDLVDARTPRLEVAVDACVPTVDHVYLGHVAPPPAVASTALAGYRSPGAPSRSPQSLLEYPNERCLSGVKDVTSCRAAACRRVTRCSLRFRPVERGWPYVAEAQCHGRLT